MNMKLQRIIVNGIQWMEILLILILNLLSVNNKLIFELKKNYKCAGREEEKVRI